MLELLLKREGALAWGFEHPRRVRPEVAPPQRIRTIPHKVWQHPGFKFPPPLMSVVTDMARERLKHGILEYGHGPYRNPWFLVPKKKPGTYRWVTAANLTNSVTIRDPNLPPDGDDFVEEFSGIAMTSLIDFFSGYDKIPLAKEDRGKIAI